MLVGHPMLATLRHVGHNGLSINSLTRVCSERDPGDDLFHEQVAQPNASLPGILSRPPYAATTRVQVDAQVIQANMRSIEPYGSPPTSSDGPDQRTGGDNLKSPSVSGHGGVTTAVQTWRTPCRDPPAREFCSA